eukprot:COSAG02_NODE_24434_length_688_cov_0.950764_1_plen_189_part_00
MQGVGRDPHVALSEGGTLAKWTAGYDGKIRWVASKPVMRGGCHRARFTVVRGTFQYYGVVLVQFCTNCGQTDPRSRRDHTFYRAYDGSRYPGRDNWSSMYPAKEGSIVILVRHERRLSGQALLPQILADEMIMCVLDFILSTATAGLAVDVAVDIAIDVTVAALTGVAAAVCQHLGRPPRSLDKPQDV